MRGSPTEINKLRRRIFREVARAARAGRGAREALEAIPYAIAPDGVPQYRESVYRERAVVAERVRLSLGLSLNPSDEPARLTDGFRASDVAEMYYEPPLVQVIPSACEKCDENRFIVSDQCMKCLARSCISACPVNAVSVAEDGRAHIDDAKCIRCGKCKAACPYEAIVHRRRPCAAACGVDAVSSDGLGRAVIDAEKCVGCGQCMVTCPFGAIADKSQIFQLIRALQEGGEIVAEVAPAIVGQFGEEVTLWKMKSALKRLGFAEVYEVALGADVSAATEAKCYAEKVATGELPFLLTSCCPSWSMLAKRQFPELADRVSSALTPMVATARTIKRERPSARVVFIGPCAAKKLEAMRRSVRSDVDFVITFEELSAIFEEQGIDPKECGEDPLHDATGAGRGYAVAGGVAAAVEACVRTHYPETRVRVEHAETLRECKKLLLLAGHGKCDGALIEGMACPGGCIGGAGVNIPAERGADAVKRFVRDSTHKVPPKDLSELKLP